MKEILHFDFLVIYSILFAQIITVKLGAVGGSSPSSPDSSSDSSPPPTPQPGEGPNLEAEHCLPGVVSNALFDIKLFFCNNSHVVEFLQQFPWF